MSLVSDCFSSSLSLFSSELLRASAASIDFLCMPEVREKLFKVFVVFQKIKDRLETTRRRF